MAVNGDKALFSYINCAKLEQSIPIWKDEKILCGTPDIALRFSRSSNLLGYEAVLLSLIAIYSNVLQLCSFAMRWNSRASSIGVKS